MKEVIDSDVKMDEEERNYLSVAYKNVAGSRRTAIRIFNHLRENARTTSNDLKLKICEDYIKKVRDEFRDISQEILDILTDKLIPEAQLVEAKVFYLKM